ncbi:hypothetical protein MMC13_002334 [Lambiella insularis]|nr:hypothetical protein [Lambiella insularis]
MAAPLGKRKRSDTTLHGPPKLYDRDDLAMFIKTLDKTTIANAIREQSSKNESLGTKKNALETLRKIGKSICLSHGVIGHEIIKSFQIRSELEETMLGIAWELTQAECDNILEGGWEDKIKELAGLAAELGVFGDIPTVINLLTGKSFKITNIGSTGDEAGSSKDDESTDDSEDQSEDTSDID